MLRLGSRFLFFLLVFFCGFEVRFAAAFLLFVTTNRIASTIPRAAENVLDLSFLRRISEIPDLKSQRSNCFAVLQSGAVEIGAPPTSCPTLSHCPFALSRSNAFFKTTSPSSSSMNHELPADYKHSSDNILLDTNQTNTAALMPVAH